MSTEPGQKITPQQIAREASIWAVILAMVGLMVVLPAWYVINHPEIMQTPLPVATGTKIQPHEKPVAETEPFLIATRELSTQAGPAGLVIAAEAIEVRDLPEGFGKESRNIGAYLYPGDTIYEIECQQIGPAVWVYHSAGWSIARNASIVYITEVCHE